MRWKIGGHNQVTGKSWQYIILARDRTDATSQARNLSLGAVDLIESSGLVTNQPASHRVLYEAMRLLVPPMVLVALTIKAIEITLIRLRRRIFSE
jgi:hypothetical protein